MVKLITDDTKTPSVSLVITGYIKSPAIISTDVINFGLLKAGQEATRIVELHPGTDPRPFELTAIENPSSNITISRIDESDKKTAKPLLKGGIGKFVVKITAPRNSGREETRIIFKTDLKERPKVLLYVKAQFEGSIVVIPQSVLFNPGDNENPFFIEKIAIPKKTINKESIVTIGFNHKLANRSLSRASLHIESGSSQIDIPIISMGN